MEWAKQRFRLKKVFSDCNNMSHYLVVILLVTSLSHLVASAEVKLETSASNNYDSRRSGDDNESNTGHPTHRAILHRSRGEDVGENVNSANKSDNVSDNEEVSKVHKQQFRPLRLPQRRHEEADDGDECDSDSGCRGSQKHASGTQQDDQSEFERIETILKDIFLDELDPEEHLHEPNNHLHNGNLESHDSHHDDDEENDQARSRHARSLEEPSNNNEGRADHEESSRRHPKGSSKLSKKKNSNEETGEDRPAHEKNKKGGKVKGSSGGKRPNKGTDLTKYNEYMDSVFRRMNSMIKTKKMDPLHVNLYAGPNKKQQNQPSKKKKKNQARMNLEDEEGSDFDADDFDEDKEDHDGPARKDVFLNISSPHGDHKMDVISSRKIRALLESVNGTTSDSEGDHSASVENGSETPRATSKESSKNKRPNKQGNRNKVSKNSKPKGTSGKGEGNNNSNKGNKNKVGGKKKNGNKTTSAATNNKPTRGVLHGLSTLKRSGNVEVIRQGEKARIVRANFLLGPVSLEIMPRKGKAGDSESVAATATAPKLKGVLEVRLKKGSPTRIRKLRVYPPKNVKVDGASSGTSTSTASKKGSNKPRQYGKVTPMATEKLRQIASTVVRQADRSHTNIKQ